MFVVALATVGALSHVYAEPIPPGVDIPLADYYSKAVSAATNEPRKALAMLELLLLPSKTGVFPDYSSLPVNERQSFKNGVEQAFYMWQRHLQADFPLELTNDPNAKVVIRFVDAIPGKSKDTKGEIKSTRRIWWSKSSHQTEFIATIHVAKYGVGRGMLSERDVIHIVAHEIGHALGLADSNLVERIMGPVVIGQAFAQVVDSEAETVRKFRASVRSTLERVRTKIAVTSSENNAITHTEIAHSASCNCGR